ncbi:unnamed protein product [Cuscuta campestris]|uniref:Uncharacterized protein n=1 Tax=Cuscuta campestris TaxID=132261 RepID=A0A484NI88_9ASTE|nr:unnamed protein product [Cuscuta campestris]
MSSEESVTTNKNKTSDEIPQRRTISPYDLHANDNPGLIITQVVLKEPFPTTSRVYRVLTQEETARATQARTRPENTAFVARSAHFDVPRDKTMTCGYCKKIGHHKDSCFQLHGYPEGWGGRVRGGGGRGRGRGRGPNTGRGTAAPPHTAHVAAVTGGNGQEPAMTDTIPSLTTDQWETFRALLASVKDKVFPFKDLAQDSTVAQEFSYIDDEDIIRPESLPKGGSVPPPLVTTASNSAEQREITSSSSAEPSNGQTVSQPESPTITEPILQQPVIQPENELMGRGHRQKTSSVRLQDYYTYTVAKENVSCKYPLTDVIGYSRFSDQHRSYLAAIDVVSEPQSYQAALKSPPLVQGNERRDHGFGEQ